MSKNLLLVAALGLFSGCVASRVEVAPPAASPPTAPFTSAAILEIMERAADWQLANPGRWEPTLWTQATFYAGAMALADLSASPRFHDAMVSMGEKAGWRLCDYHRSPYDADDHCVGQIYAELYLRHRDPKMLAPTIARFEYVLAHPKDDNLVYDRMLNPDRRDRWSWCDALFMGPPAWVRLSAATGKQAYLDFAVEKWWQTSDYLYDPTEHLYFRDSTFFARREANGSKIFWGRGNGWVMGGLVRVLQFLPADHPARPRFVRQFQEMAARVQSCQQPDGLWRASLLDPASYPLRETSGSGFFTYALAWGVNQGLLERAKFEPAVKKAWLALADCVSPDGRLSHVQPVGGDPRRFDENATEVYGVGAFLLASSEVYRMVGAVTGSR
jgi:rhamnogalacturonyl hydrolase YesR